MKRLGRNLSGRLTLAWLLLVILLLTTRISLQAMEQKRTLAQDSMRLYKTEQGLPQNEVRSVAQTPDGYLWFGTRDGLARFDGVHFTIFRSETTPGIGHNMFGAMLVDHAGRLWVATGDGLSCYEHGQFRRYTEQDGLPANAIHSLLEDRTGKLWVGTWNGLAAFDGIRFHQFTTRNGLPGDSISGLAEDGAGGLWVGTHAGMAHMVDGKVTVLTEKDGLPSDFIQALFHDRAGQLWVGTLTGSVVLMPPGKFRPLNDLPGKAICFYQDRTGAIWAATEKTFGRYPGEPGSAFEKEEGPNRDVETLFEDRDGSLWVGTSGAGVARYRSGIFNSYTRREGLADDNATTIFEDARGQIWIGGASGLSRKDANGFSVISERAYGGGSIRSIAEDNDGVLWVGTSRGITRFDGRRWMRMDALPIDVHVVFKDHAGRIWIGSSQGITIWDQGQISRLDEADGLAGKYVMSILEDQQGAVWVGTITGLMRLDHGAAKTYTMADGLSSNYIQSLHQDARGTIWICTPSGLDRLRDGHFYKFSTRDGLSSDSTLQLLEDAQHRFWISSYRGIFRVNREDLDALAEGAIAKLPVVSYGTEDGMKSVACGGLGLQPAGWAARDGTLWFPTDAGIVSVHPSALPPPDPSPTPVLESVMMNGVASDSTTVQPGMQRIDFAFTAPTSIAPEDIHFRYRMQGYEDEWHDAGLMRQISFTNLPHGRYKFVLSAQRSGSPWSRNEASVSLRVLPHYYETAWFYTASGLLVVLLIWLAYSIRVRATEERLETIMGERARVAQELHDTLLQSVSGAAMEIRGALRFLGRGAADVGVRQISIALDHLGKSMADARQAIWDLRSPETVDQRLDRLLEVAAQRVCAGGPQLNFEISGNPHALPPALEKNAYRIGMEAITNAVRHSGCSKVSMRLHYQPDSILLFVHDDGIGFDCVGAESSPLSNHWGLAGMKERASQCSGRMTIESTPGIGTIIQFEAPL